MPHFTQAQRALALLVGVTLLIRLGWAAVLDVGVDEAYNYLYTVHPDWSFFDHPPMTMLVGKAGLLLCGDVVHPLSLRLGYILLFAGSTWVLYRLTARWYGEWSGFYAALAFNLAAFFTAAAGAFAIPDGPFLFFTLLTIWALSVALVASPGQLIPWLWVGLAWGGAMLSKYHAVLIPAGAVLYILLTPSVRRLLWSPGPYLATVIGALGFLPVVYWNASHDWVSFLFQGSRAVGLKLRPAGPIIVVAGTMAVLFPWMWFSLVTPLVSGVRRFSQLREIDRLLICVAAVPLGFFLGISCIRRVMMHWPLVGFVPLFCLVGERWAAFAIAEPARMRRHVAVMAGLTVTVALAVLAQAKFGVLSFPGRDPCSEFSGWPSVVEQLQERKLLDDPNCFVFSGCWDDCGQLAFATRNKVPVACYSFGDARGFAFWSKPEDYLGKNGILVSTNDNAADPGQFADYFRQIEQVAEVPVTRNGKPFRRVRFFRCTCQVQPFPFTYQAK